MFLKILIIGSVIFGLGFAFSSQISGLFPNSSETVPKAINDDVNQIGSEAVINMSQKFDESIETAELKIGESINNSIESSKQTIDNSIKPNLIDSLGNFFKNLFGS